MSEHPSGPRYGQVDQAYGRRLAMTPTDEDGPVWMVNLMKYRDIADYADGRASTITGRQADDLYTPRGPLAAIGAEIVFAGDVDRQPVGEAPVWDRVGVVRYPTRRSFVEMQSRPDFRQLHAHKDAGMLATIVIGCQPMPAPVVAASPADGGLMVIDVLRFADPAVAAPASTRTGGRVAGWFAAEGTIVGDGRRWDEVRFHAYPSAAAASAGMARTSREPAIVDAYTLIVSPSSTA